MFTPKKKYVLTKDLGDEFWKKKGTIVDCLSVGDVNFFTHPLASLDGPSKFALDEEDSLIELSEYYKEFGFDKIEEHKSVKLNSGKDVIVISITSTKRNKESWSVKWKYCITVNDYIKVVGSGYSGEDKLPSFVELIKLYKND